MAIKYISLTGLNPGSLHLYPTCLCIELDAMHRFLQSLLLTRFSNTFGYFSKYNIDQSNHNGLKACDNRL